MSAPFIPFARPVVDEAMVAAVADTLRSRWLASGPQVAAFEAALSAYVGGRPVRTFSAWSLPGPESFSSFTFVISSSSDDFSLSPGVSVQLDSIPPCAYQGLNGLFAALPSGAVAELPTRYKRSVSEIVTGTKQFIIQHPGCGRL